MIKILFINGSPRKNGNTEIILREIIGSAKREGADAEIINLVDFTLEPCNGCETCLETGSCIINDDVEKIFEKIKEADGVIIASSVYFFNATAQLKTFIDRVGYLNIARKRDPFRNRVGGAIAVAARTGSTGALSQIAMFLSASRMIMVAPLVTVIASGKETALRDTRGIDDAYELAHNIIQVAGLTKPLRIVA